MSEDNIRERERAFKSAAASVEMEGYKLSLEEKDLCMQFICDKISKDTFIKMVLERCEA